MNADHPPRRTHTSDLLDGGPDTPVRTNWHDGVEYWEVPAAELRAALASDDAELRRLAATLSDTASRLYALAKSWRTVPAVALTDLADALRGGQRP